MKKSKAYVQFSKRVVLLVTIAVTIACYAAIAFCFVRSDMGCLVDTIKAYIQYATIVFAAYSGNSAVEKWLVNRNRINTAESASTPDDTAGDDVG